MTPLRDHTATRSADPAHIDLKFAAAGPELSAECAASALELIAEAADVIKSIERRAIESETFAKSLAERTIENLHHADLRIQVAEDARRAGEDNLATVNACLQKMQKELMHTKSRLATTEDRLANTSQRTKSFEQRAIQAEKAVKEVESAISTQILRLAKESDRRPSADAA